MANTYVLGGSPLGLINTKSSPERTGMSTFNGGRSRNVNVFYYNRGVKQPTNNFKSGKEIYAGVSLMSGGSLPKFWPNADIGKIGSENPELGILEDSKKDTYTPAPGVGISNRLHNDSAYDTSILNIVEKLSKSKSAALRPSDFAYCKYLGVYPNNRLMIARRFPGPTGDNIFSKGGSPPKAILISWKPDNEDFLEFNFGEEWTDADADFTNVLNKLGKDFGIDNTGGGLSKAINLIPLPGFTEQIQRQILEAMGVLKPGSSGQPLPSGNPNIIKMAKRRKTVGYGEAAAGLKATISVKMNCEYEQKFISGIDPTVAWQDILNNILIFGTSNSSNYGLDKKFEANLRAWTNNPGKLVTAVINAVKNAVKSIINTVTKEAEKALKNLNEAISTNTEQKEPTEEEQKKKNEGLVDKAKKQITKFFDKIVSSAFATISKYKVEIMGIANALSGSPSTPWHITIGNPLRPFFCCGDMLPSGEVTVKFGPQLAFNDLPSSIKVEFTLQNARPLGMQEILAKFNSGNLRTVNVKKDYIENDLNLDPKASDADNTALLESVNNDYFDATFDFTGDALQGVVDSGSASTGGSVSNTLTLNFAIGENIETVKITTDPVTGSVSRTIGTVSKSSKSDAFNSDLVTAPGQAINVPLNNLSSGWQTLPQNWQP
jgi:vacuolar-type H+-ATPase subunit H